MMWDWYGGAGWSWAMFAGMMVFWIVVVILVIWALRTFLPRPHSEARDGNPSAPSAPLEVLNRRYAAGEIAKAEYDEKKRDILSS